MCDDVRNLCPWTLHSVLVVLALSGALFGACEGEADAGGACTEDAGCLSGLCYASFCVEPEGDLDGDGLTNVDEARLGTRAQVSDSDGDGLPDLAEVGGDPSSPIDTDGDYIPGANQRHDANESAIADMDGDCIADQFDAMDDQSETDMARVATLSCRRLGVCGEDGGLVVATCSSEGLVCTYDDVMHWEPVEVSCDGRDNDCDGALDEGMVYTAEDGAFLGVGEACAGAGECMGDTGVVECMPGGGVGCSTSAGGSEGPSGLTELPCNQLDDDCDGLTDGLAFYQGGDGQMLGVGEPCQAEGICFNHVGVVTCVEGSTTALCSTGPGGRDDVSQAEVCNGADDDCDGEVDEGLFYEALDSGDSIPVGAECGVEGTPCESMTVGCLDGVPTCCLGSQPCVPWQDVTQVEGCDGADNDCDGAVDEALAMDTLCADAQGVCALVSGDVGSCAQDGQGEWRLTCDYTRVMGWEAEETLCDDLDNDCDGQVDEGLSLGLAGASLGLGEPCEGVGACAGASGVVACHEGGVRCDALSSASPESCNGLDDDCDGSVDEALSQPVDEALAGLCLSEGVCAGSQDEQVCTEGDFACAHVLDPLFEPQEVSCDLLDNDCDGWTDEGTAKAFTTVVSGVRSSQPVDRARWRLVRGQGALYLFGGLHERPLDDGGASGRPLADLWRYIPASEEWEALAASPSPRAGHALTWSEALDGLIVHGGFEASVANGELSADAASDTMLFWHRTSNTWHSVSQVVDAEESSVLGRVHHSLTSRGDGSVVMHGGHELPVGATQTWRGELTIEGEGASISVACVWSEAPHQAASRFGHEAVYDDVNDRVLLVGGITAPSESFASVLMDGAMSAWEPLGSVGKTQPTPRRDMAVAYHEGQMVVVGGLGADASPLSDAWAFDSESGGWSALDLPEGVPVLTGAFMLADSDSGVWRLGGGRSTEFVSWRQTWPLTFSGLTWGAPSSWLGLAPRTGATLVVDLGGERMWLLGGSRMPGAFPLMDALELSHTDETWQGKVAALAPVIGALDVTRPALVGAAGVWSPVDEVVLLAGGRDLNTGALSSDLWAFHPASDALGAPSHFSKLATYGDVPPGVRDPVFAVDAKGMGWFAGRFELTGEAAGLEVRIYQLDLTSYTWTQRWPTSTDSANFPEGAALLGGVGADGLYLLALSDQTAPSLWRFDAAESVLTELSLTVPATTWADIISWGYDPMSEQWLVTTSSEGGPAAWQVSVDSVEMSSLAAPPSWPGSLRGAAVAIHPWLGATIVGGHDPSGFTTGAWATVQQVCP